MHDQPEPTEEEQDEGQERQQDEEAMRGPGHEDPDQALEEGPAEE